MPFLNFSPEDLIHTPLVPEGTTALLQCINVLFRPHSLYFTFHVCGSLTPVHHELPLPHKGLEKEEARACIQAFAVFCDALQVPLAFENPDEFIGHGMYAKLGIHKHRNIIREVLPRKRLHRVFAWFWNKVKERRTRTYKDRRP